MAKDNSVVPNAPHKNFEEIKKIDENGVEYWEARELMPLLKYTEWRNFKKVISKAIISCKKSKQPAKNHFVDVNKMVTLGSGSKRKVKDYKLSRYACYLIAQNGDPSKDPIATAQTYFAVQTRKQELYQELNEDMKRLFIREEVRKQNKKLFFTAKKAGVKNFGKFNNMGYLGLYGMGLPAINKKKGIGKDDVLDRAGATELAANLFRITQTDDKIVKEKIKGEGRASMTHYSVGHKVRKTIEEIGGAMPENLLPAKHVKRIEGKEEVKKLK
jgi:DNA-damage-inducible protein D